MNGEDEKNTAPVDIADIANDVFDSAGVTDDTELEFSHEGIEPDTEDKSLDNDGDIEKPVDQEEKKPTQAEADTKLYAGQFKTVEELEKAFVEKTQGITQQVPQPQPAASQPKADDIVDLDDRELTLLMEQSEQDGKDYHVEYLRDKMHERELQPFEVEALKSLDAENGTNLFQEYITTSTKRDVMKEFQPILQPLQEEQNRKAQEAYVEREKMINATLETEFGKDTLDELERKIKDSNYINEVLGQSEIGHVIVGLWDSGQQALSHKMLLQETQRYENSKANVVKQKKKASSVPADIGSNFKGSKKTSNKAATIEEAFEQALQENS